MLRRDHQLKADLGRIYSFSLGLRMDEDGYYRRPDVMACRIYARQTLEDIARSQDDPFNYRLLDLWLDVFQRPWDQPTNLHQLLDDLAREVGRGDLKVYLEYDPSDCVFDASGAGNQKTGSNAEAGSGEADEIRTQQPQSNNSNQPTRQDDDNPHPGLHNREWDSVEEDQFTTRRQVDMDNLSEEEKAAARQLRKQGRTEEKIEEVLTSGDDFRLKELKPGDKLYGFDDVGNKYGNKNPASPYWLDEAGYQDVKAKFYKDGAWDREGVKNYLALPCSNRANVIDTATVQEPQIGVESNIGKATEQIGYTTGNYSTGMMAKMMSGGGTQVAPDKTAMSDVERLKGTP